MKILNDINWKVLQRDLLSSLNEDEFRFRKVWVAYTKLGSVQFTLFSPYTNGGNTGLTKDKFIDCNKNVFSYVRSLVPGIELKDEDEIDVIKAREVLTLEFVKLFRDIILSEFKMPHEDYWKRGLYTNIPAWYK